MSADKVDWTVFCGGCPLIRSYTCKGLEVLPDKEFRYTNNFAGYRSNTQEAEETSLENWEDVVVEMRRVGSNPTCSANMVLDAGC